MRKTLLVLLLSLSAFVLSAQIYPQAGADWAQVRPSKHGFDNQQMREIRRYVIDSMNTTGLMVIVGGECIFKYGNVERLSYLASCRKSVLAMLYGKYVENGTIDLDKTIGEIGITDHGGLLPVEQKATVRHLIQARSGVYHQASTSGSALDNPKIVPERGSKRPGSYFLYNNWDFNAAGTVFEKLTGKSIYRALEEDLALPLGFQDWDIEKQRYGGRLKRSMHRSYHMYLSTRDMARLGYLMLREGRWNGEQVISKRWHAEMLKEWTPRSQMNPKSRRKGAFAYGYMWWLYKTKEPAFKGAYTARGMMGQYITVLPALDMVVAHKTDAIYGRKTSYGSYRNFLHKVIAAKVKSE